MAEERTVSTFTWLTPALRSRLSIGSMSAMTQVRQFYKTESKVSIHVKHEIIISYAPYLP